LKAGYDFNKDVILYKASGWIYCVCWRRIRACILIH